MISRWRRESIEKTEAEVRAVPDDWHLVLPPIFIVGFWRSGTTLLHELMAADRTLAAPILIDVLCPSDAPYLRGWKRRLLQVVQPPTTRGIDDVQVFFRSPQEEEAALCHLGAPSFFAASYFPRRRGEIIEEALFARDGTEPERRWREAYASFLRTLVVAYPGRRLVLKNPANCTRLRRLIQLCPEAMFIRIDRDPAEVIPSFERLINLGDRYLSLQGRWKPMSADEATALHRRVMARFDADWAALPARRTARVAYADLIRDPLSTIGEIYETLELPRGKRAERQQKRFWLRRGRFRKPGCATRPPTSASVTS
ncbi:sulfotransferase [Hansschlegelia sp.]|uniref:sulfotransferase family protein n=1 Tax=Hansschlegelia sp. TaxID=2041892 RepID=UPI002C0F05BF|nr:sulfotransferase [Hansschlegelia sp.]HVI28777.1 sulfotransferase [Hansschlegelia sp.]